MMCRYEIYDLQQAPRPLEPLDDSNAAMNKFFSKTRDLKFLVFTSNMYMLFNGINVFLFLTRIFQLLDFQPRIGILTQSLSHATVDLLHFFILMGIVYLGYTFMGCALFGYRMHEFSTLSSSAATCFELLIGNDDIRAELLSSSLLTESIYSAIFFYSFMIVVFLIILNFLLAIVVDAFALAKNECGECPSVWEDIGAFLSDEIAALTSKDYRSAYYTPSLEKHVATLLTRKPQEVDRRRKSVIRNSALLSQPKVLQVPPSEGKQEVQAMELSEAKLKWLLSGTGTAAPSSLGPGNTLAALSLGCPAGTGSPVEDADLADRIMYKYGVMQERNQNAEEGQSHLTMHGTSAQVARLDRLEQMLLEMSKTIRELQPETPVPVPAGKIRDALQPPDAEVPASRGEPVDGKEAFHENIDHASLGPEGTIDGIPTDPASPNGSEATHKITMDHVQFDLTEANQEISVDNSTWELSAEESSPGPQPAPASIEASRRSSGSIFNPLNPNIASQQSGNEGEKEEKRHDLWTFNNVFTCPTDELNI
ncbi:hypothetical protein CYMTET_12973 [Cymbomonas tetramitiformis]|uniref:Polycystin cation channel PKD1/PKD2 domain-containing protein n=1 Tax=Cymbomonas tetramitiformis TaxID=36881 RepID=A0AAE0GJ11_9CHLO|nr:hypothetical protein CYMTET_12973 [Cymbomonas tetramitiformis]